MYTWLIIIIIIFYILYCNYYFFMKPSEFERIEYNDIKPKTGDIILFKCYTSYLPLVKAVNFSHIGIIICIDNIPYVLEMYNPCPYITSLRDKLMEKDGNIVFYKELKKPMTVNQLKKVEQYLKESEKILYRDYMYQCNTEEKEKAMVCTEYIFHLLRDAGVINSNKYRGEFLLDYLSEMDDIYEKPKHIVFFHAVRRYTFSEIAEKMIFGLGVKTKLENILNMPLLMVFGNVSLII